MKSKFTWIFTLLLAFFIQFAFAQERTISGVVSDAQGLPIPGVNVTVEGVAGGVQTDFDGRYAIQASTGQRIKFSMVGMAEQTVPVGASNTVSVTLKEDNVLLDQVVVVGYGVTTPERFTGTATKIDNRNLEAKTVSNVSQALRGEVAGVNVITTSGAPGSDANIRIRGFGSITGNQAPLYVVDGAPWSSDLSAINPADIESVVILKDAAATSIYGTRGANGVILITTKLGREGVTRITVETRSSINTQLLPTYNTIESPEEYIEIEWSELYQNARLSGEANPAAYANANLYSGPSGVGIDPGYNIWNVPGDQLIDPATGKFRPGVSRRFTPTKWSDAAFNTGFRQEANVQFSGGSGSTRYSTSFGYLDDEGYTIKSNFRRYTTRLNLEHKPKDWLTIGGNMAYTGTRYINSSSDEGSANSSGNIFALTNTTPAIYDVYLRDADGNIIPDPIYGGGQFDYGGGELYPYTRRAWNLTNGIGDAYYDLSQSDGTTLLGNFNLGIELMDGLTFEMRYSGQHQTFESSDRQNPFYGSGFSSEGFLSKSTTVTTNQNFLQLMRYNKTFGSHRIEAFAAHESTEWRFKSLSAAAQKAINPNTLDLAQYTTPFGRGNSYTQGWTLDSYFAQLNYDYNQKYFLTGSVRRDGTSNFPLDPWGTFGSVGASWIISKESFMSGLDFVDFLKLKASYGILGERALTGTTTSLMYGIQVSQIVQTPDGSISYGHINTLANRSLTWETSKIAQVGIESMWFDNRLSLDVDYYSKNTTDLIFSQQLPVSTGYTNLQYNSGRLRNSGFEFDLKADLVRGTNPEDFSFSVGVNGEIIKNRISDMPITYNRATDAFTNNKLFQQDGNFGWREGGSIYDWYMREWAGVDPATGAGLWTMYFDDANSNGIFDAGDTNITNMETYRETNSNPNLARTTTDVYSDATQMFVGKSAMPKFRGAFRLNAGWQNFDFTALFGYSIGGYVYDTGYQTLMNTGGQIGANNFHTDIRDRWQQPGDITNVPRLTANYGQDTNFSAVSSRWLTKADYLALNNVRVGYTVPQRFMENSGISMLNFALSGDNLLMFSERKGLNPQTMIATTNSGIYMPMTTFSLGVKVEF